MILEDLTITKHGTKLVVCHETRGKLGTIDTTTGATKDAKRGNDVGSWVSGRGMSVAEVIAAMVVA